MTTSLGTATVDVQADTDGIESGVGGAFKKAAAIATAAFATIGGTLFVKDAIMQASDLGESINAMQVVLGDAADDFLKFGENAATQLGLTQSQLNAALTPTAALLKNAGSSGEVLSGQLEQLAVRASDVGSIFNTDVNEVLDAFNAAMRGETEPIRRFGVNLDDAALSAKAVELGLAASEKEATKAAKTQAAMALILDQTSAAQGDFANTSDGLANSMKILEAQISEAKTALGAPLAAPLVDIMKAAQPLIDQLVPAFGVLGDALAEGIIALGPGLTDLIKGLTEGIQAIAPALPGIGEAFGAIFSALSPLLPAIGQLIGTLLPPLADLVTLVVQSLAPLIELVAEFAVGLLDELMPAIEPILDVLGQLVGEVGEQLTPVIAALIPMLLDLVGALVPIIPPLLDILTALLPIIPPLSQLALLVANLVLPILTQLAPVLSGVAKVVSKVVGGMIKGLVSAFNFLLKTVSALLNGLIDIYNNTVGRIPGVKDITKVDLQIQVDTNFADLAVPAIEQVKVAQIDTSKAISASAADVAKVSGAAAKKAGKQAAEAAKKAEKTMAANIDKIEKKMAAATDKAVERYETLRDLRDEFSQGLKDASKGLFNLGIGNEFGSDIELIQRSMDQAIAVTKEFKTLTAQLDKRGIGDSLLSQLLELGPEAGIATARALAAASDEQLKSLRANDKALTAAGASLAKQGTSQLGLDTAAAQAKSAADAAKAQERAVVKALEKLDVNVYIGQKELDKIVTTVVKEVNRDLKRAATSGSRAGTVTK